jgi:hypothetical protein
MTPNLDALAQPTFLGWPEPSPQTKATTEALLAALVPLLAPVKPHVYSGSAAEYTVETWWGDCCLAFFVFGDGIDYVRNEAEGGEWVVADGLLEDGGKLRELVAWLVGAA